jgi:hypothetical protein
VAEVRTMAFNFYPNPARDVLTLNSSTPIRQIAIIDMQGREVLEFVANAERVVVLQLEELALGSYFLRVLTDERIYSEQFVKN